MIICQSNANRKQFTVLRLWSKFDKSTNQMEFKTTYLGSFSLSTDRPLSSAFCIYSMGKREDSQCQTLMMAQVDLTLSYLKIPSVGLVKHVEPRNDVLDLAVVEVLGASGEFILDIEYELENGIIFARESLFFQNLDSKYLNEWSAYNQTQKSEGLLGAWRRRASINWNYLSSTTASILGKIAAGDWNSIFGSRKAHDDFLGFNQKMVVLTEKFKLHLMDWEGLKVKKTVDLFDLIQVHMSPDFKQFWGSTQEEVMTWLPINMFLAKDMPKYMPNPPGEEDPVRFEDTSTIDHADKNPQRLTLTINESKRIFHGCNIRKLDSSVNSGDFYVMCILSVQVSPFIIFKVNADTLSLVPMKLRELREAALELDALITKSYLKQFASKPGFPFEIYPPGQKPKPHDRIKWVKFDSRNGKVTGINHESDDLWNIRLGKNTQIIEIIRSENREGEVSRINQVSGNLVLQRVNDANITLMLVDIKPQDAPEKDTKRHVNLLILDIESGKVLKTLSLVKVEQENVNMLKSSLKVFIVDHTYYIMFKTAKQSEYYVFSVVIFRKAIQQDILKIIKDYFRGVASLPPLDHLSEEPETVILDRMFLLPFDANILGFSKTKDDVTQKSLFFSCTSGQIYAIPQITFSPQRMTKKQKEAKEKHIENGTLHYTKRDADLQYMIESYPVYEKPRITLHPGLSVSKNVPLQMVKFFASEGTFLESTSLVILGGIDWFAIRYSPDGLYDRVNPDFKKSWLILGIIAISGILFASKMYGNLGIAKKRYLSQNL